MSLSGPARGPPARENWKVGSVKVSSLPPSPPKERPHLHPACVPYHLLYTEGKLLIPLPQLAMNRTEPPAKNNPGPCWGAAADTSFHGIVEVSGSEGGERVNTLYCLCGGTLLLKDLQMDRTEATTLWTLR